MKISYKALGVIILLSFGGVFLLHFSPIFQIIKGGVYDFFEMQSLRYEQVRDDIIIVGVDKKTIEYFGQQGSWSRSYYEGLLREIESHNPKVVAFDYFFTSKERPEKVDWDIIQKLSGLRTEQVDVLFDNYHQTISDTGYISTIDTDFAGVMKQYNNVVLPSVLRVSLTGAILDVDKKPFDIYESVSTVGYANAFPDADGVIRSFIPVMGGLDSFPLGIAKKFTTINAPLADKKILINYNSRPYDRYRVVSFYKAYNGIWEDYHGKKVDVSGKIVLIGDYDESLGDTYKTPVSDANVTPGVEIVANEVATLLSKGAVRVLDDQKSTILFVVLIIVCVFLFFSIRTIFLGSIVFLIMSILIIVLDFFFFFRGWYVDYITLFFAVFFPYLGVYSYQIFRTFRDKRRIERIFSRHVDRSIINELLQKDISDITASEKREITVLFSDIEGFTSISEGISSEALVRVLNKFFHIVNGVILENRGTINKYIGDAVLAFWGAPLKNENHPLATCTTALLIQKALHEQMETFQEDNIYIPLNVRFGITTGEVIVGNIGDANFSDYTIIGDSVNLASRLEGVNKIYHTNIILSEETAERVSDYFILRKLDKISVKGKSVATIIYELLDFKENKHISRYESIIANHERALVAYFNQDWEVARNYFSLNVQLQDPVATIFIERIKSFELNPVVGDWDGVYRLSSK